MIRYVRSMELHYGDGFSVLIEEFKKVVQYQNSHCDAETLYFGMMVGDNKVVQFSTDFEDMAAYARWQSAMMADEAYWQMIGETVGPFTHLILKDTDQLLRSM